jgi:hypothetical protein
MKARTVEPKQTAVARQRFGKHIPVAMNTHATVEKPLEAVFTMWSMPRLRNVDQQDS